MDANTVLLARNDIVKTFIDNIMEGMSPNMALAQMLWEGFPLSGMDFQVMGLREMLQKLQSSGMNYSPSSALKRF